MADNCIGVSFDMSCDGSGNTQDSGEYLQGVGLPLSGGVDGLDQTGMGASNCNSLATSHFQENNCEMMAGQEQLSRLSREATQRQSIPPLGPRATMRSASGTSNDFGGLSFQCQDEPFASVTGKGKEGYNEPDISSEPPWWALTALGWVAGLKKQKSCICPQQDGSSITLTDCNRLQPCEKCCTNSTGGYAGGGYDPNQSSLTEG